ncbi:MAG: hypothetical protein AAB320_05575 [Elusimicrobiota bacterium]
MARALPALLLAILLTPAASLGQEWPEFSKDYHRQVISLLRRLPATRRHAAFILDSRVALEVTDNPTKVDDHVQAVYDMVERRISIDEVRLLEGAEELIDQGAPRALVAEILAWKTLPTIVHEITHAMSHRDQERLLGGRFLFGCLESELLSFYDELLVQHELYKERPDLWRRDKILKIERSYGEMLLSWRRGQGELDAQVRAMYGEAPSLLSAPKEELVAGVARRILVLEGSLAELRGLRREAEGALRRDEVVRRDFQRLAEAIAYTESLLEAKRATRQALADDASRGKLQDRYRAELAKRRGRLEELRGEVR